MTYENRLQIPIRIKGRGTIIGFCRGAPYGGGLTLATIPKLSERPEQTDDCVVIPQGMINVRLQYDSRDQCYWADDYACLASEWVDPY